MILPMGAAPKAPPPSVLSRYPFVYGVNAGDLLCGTSIESIESIRSIESIEPVESSDSIEYRVYIVYRAYRICRIVRIYSFGTRGFQTNAFFHFWKCYFNNFFVFFELFLGLGTPLKSSGTL